MAHAPSVGGALRSGHAARAQCAQSIRARAVHVSRRLAARLSAPRRPETPGHRHERHEHRRPVRAWRRAGRGHARTACSSRYRALALRALHRDGDEHHGLSGSRAHSRRPWAAHDGRRGRGDCLCGVRRCHRLDDPERHHGPGPRHRCAGVPDPRRAVCRLSGRDGRDCPTGAALVCAPARSPDSAGLARRSRSG